MPFENWEADTRLSKTSAIIIASIILVSVIGVGYGLYKITSPDSDPVTSTEVATLSKPTVSSYSVTVGDTITISSTLSDGSEGLQVFFLENGESIGSAYTNSNGQALIQRTIPSTGTFIYTAECDHP